ncbi:MAG: hypothetical protein KIT69_03305 [Propionibacteriaceae bacterium]|nr:hypothetical protein [Propionibacteriaceae bacterium]
MATAATQAGTTAATTPVAWSDPREEIEIGVLMANGRLAPRSFATRADAEDWAIDGEQVVEYNRICACDI